MTEPSGRFRIYLRWVVGVLVLAGVYLTGLYSSLFFHSLSAFFSIIIAVGVFAVAWNSRRFRENTYLLFLGIGYLFVGALDLLYLLAYRDMGVFPGVGADLPTQLWFAARLLEGLSLFLAPLCIGRRLNLYAVFGGYLLAFTAVILEILVWRLLPVNLAEAGPGLIALHKTGEYITSVILLGSMALLWRRREEFAPEVLRPLLGAIAVAVGSELALTFFADVFPHAAVLGRVLKMLSCYLVYQALIATELKRPYELLFRNLRQSETAVRKERELADSLMETAPVMIMVLDRQGRIARCSRAWEKITGYAFSEMKDRIFWEVFPALEEVEAVKEMFSHILSGNFPQVYESEWVARDGARRLIAWHHTGLIGDDGEVEYVIGSGLDITDQRAAENPAQRLTIELERRIQDVTKLTRELEGPSRELERFTYAASRDLRALLRWVNSYCGALEESCADRLDFKGRSYLQQLRQAIRRMEEILGVLLHHSRLAHTEIRRQEFDLGTQALAIIEDLKSAAPDRQVDFIIGPGLTAEGDPTMLRSVLENLLGEAWRCTAHVPQGRIEFGALPPSGGRREFFVRDNRADLDLNYSHLLVQASQRLQPGSDFSGAGAGLATVKRIIQRHGGRVWAEGAAGQGATVYFSLPTAGQGPG